MNENLSNHRQSRCKFLSAMLGVHLLLTCCGCGQGGAKVAGKVSLDSSPVPEGYVLFYATSNLETYSTEIKNGAFVFATEQGVKPGDYDVEVQAKIPTGRMTRDPDIPNREIPGMRQVVRTGLSATVPAEGTEDLTFEIQSAPPRSRRRR